MLDIGKFFRQLYGLLKTFDSIRFDRHCAGSSGQVHANSLSSKYCVLQPVVPCYLKTVLHYLVVNSEERVDFLTLYGMGSEKSDRYGEGWIPPPSLFPLFEGQLKRNLVVCKYVTSSIQNVNKIDDVITGPL